MRDIVFDTETTGLSPKNGDRMVEIGCVELVDMRETGRTLHMYFNPERDMPAEAERVHGLSEKFLSDKPLFAEKAEEMLAFFGDDLRLVAHNAKFDMGFINAELARCGHAPFSYDRMVDTAAHARRKFPGSPASLDALCSRFGIDRSHRVKHGALLDAELLVQVYIELNGGRQIRLGLDNGQDGDGTDGQYTAHILSGVKQIYRKPRPHSPMQDELANHRAFIGQMKKPLWGKVTQD